VKLRRRPPRKARIEIVPMIDTVFFLLVFFMMASLAMTMYRGVPVNLPHAATGQSAVAENATITLTRDGQTYLNREPVDTAGLPSRLKPLLAANPSLAVIINADSQVAHGRVVDVLDGVRGVSVSRLAIAVVPEGKP
jgi:biopolymer transport protein ExbD